MSTGVECGATLLTVKRKSINLVETTYLLSGYDSPFTILWTNKDYFGDSKFFDKYQPQEWVESDDNKLACLISNIIHDGLDCSNSQLKLYMQFINDFNNNEFYNYSTKLSVDEIKIDDFGQYALVTDREDNTYYVSMHLPEPSNPNPSYYSTPCVNEQPISSSSFHKLIYCLAKKHAYKLFSGDNNDMLLSHLSFAFGSKITSYRKAKPFDATSVQKDWEDIAKYIKEHSVIVGFDELNKPHLFELSSFDGESCYVQTQLDDFYLMRCCNALDYVDGR